MRSLRRTVTVLAAGLLLLVGTATAALAHVHVDSPDAAQGGYATLTFTVPTESDTASTTGITVTLPSKVPLAYVATQPKPGWTVTTKETTYDPPVSTGDANLSKAVTSVTWKADGDGIAPQQFDTFVLRVGPLPKEESLSLPVDQTYSDGKVVSWSQPTPASGEEPEYPAPMLLLSAASADGHGDHGDGDADSESMVTASSSSADGGSSTLGIVGLVVGGVGVLLGGAALLVARRRTPSAT